MNPLSFGLVCCGIVSPGNHVVQWMAGDLPPGFAYRTVSRSGGGLSSAVCRGLLLTCHSAKTHTERTSLSLAKRRRRNGYQARGGTNSNPRYSPRSQVSVTRMNGSYRS